MTHPKTARLVSYEQGIWVISFGLALIQNPKIDDVLGEQSLLGFSDWLPFSLFLYFVIFHIANLIFYAESG